MGTTQIPYPLSDKIRQRQVETNRSSEILEIPRRAFDRFLAIHGSQASTLIPSKNRFSSSRQVVEETRSLQRECSDNVSVEGPNSCLSKGGTSASIERSTAIFTRNRTQKSAPFQPLDRDSKDPCFDGIPWKSRSS